MSKLDDLISKSLEDIDALVEDVNKSLAAQEDLSKANADEPAPNEVAEDAGQENEDATPDEDADNESEQDADPAEEDEDVEKSLEDELKSNDGVRNALEVSGFLSELVKGLSVIINGQNDKLTKSIHATTESNELLVKSFTGIVKTQKAVLEMTSSLHKSVGVLTERVKQLESKPAPRKSAANTQVVEKSFAKSTGGETKLTKSQISNKLTDAIQKGQAHLVSDLLAFESLGTVEALSIAAQDIINGK